MAVRQSWQIFQNFHLHHSSCVCVCVTAPFLGSQCRVLMGRFLAQNWPVSWGISSWKRKQIIFSSKSSEWTQSVSSTEQHISSCIIFLTLIYSRLFYTVIYCEKSVQCVCCYVLVMVSVILWLGVVPVILCGWRTPLDTSLMRRATVVRSLCDIQIKFKDTCH